MSAAGGDRTESPFGDSAHTVAVLGVGAVGGMVAARVAAAGQRVICVARPQTAEALRVGGIELETPDGVVHARPDAVERLEEHVALLVVAVKAYALAEALERIEVFAVADGIVLPLLNGLEHPELIRRRLGPRVAAGSISRFSGELTAPGRVVQRSASACVTVARGDLTRPWLERGVAPLRAAGLEVVMAHDEDAVLWEKAARVAVVAAATSATQRSVGELRDDPDWRPRLEAALVEACAVATAHGVPQQPADHWAIIEAMPYEASTSTALDVARGRPSELDAIAGSVLRAARRRGVSTPALAELVAAAEDACRPR